MALHKHLLVVGGTGFIGSHIVRAGLQRGYEIVVASLTARRPLLDPGGQIELLQLDITDQKDTVAKLSGRVFSHVINASGYIDHRAIGQGGRTLVDQHLNGLLTLVEALDREHLKSFVNLGSSDEYGNQPAPQDESMREEPIAPYSFAKCAATHLLQMMYRTEGFPGKIARIFLTYGPGQDSRRFLPQVVLGCLADRDIPTSEGQQLRDFCYVEDVASGLFQLLESEKADGEVVNIASGQPIAIRDMFEKIRSIIGAGRPEYGKYPYRPGENMRLFASIEKAKRLIGFEPATSLDDGLARTIDYYRDLLSGR